MIEKEKWKSRKSDEQFTGRSREETKIKASSRALHAKLCLGAFVPPALWEWRSDTQHVLRNQLCAHRLDQLLGRTRMSSCRPVLGRPDPQPRKQSGQSPWPSELSAQGVIHPVSTVDAPDKRLLGPEVARAAAQRGWRWKVGNNWTSRRGGSWCSTNCYVLPKIFSSDFGEQEI